MVRSVDPSALLAARLRPLGLDLTASASRASIEAADAGAAATLPSMSREDAWVVLVGNTRALWPPFVEALSREPALQASVDPVDGYTQRAVRDAAASVAADLGVAHATRYAFVGPPDGIAAQRLAAAMGLAAQSPSHLSVHRHFGPWVALRAAVIFDVAGPPASPARLPCEGCAAPCLPLFDVALEGLDRREAAGAIEADPAPWIATRDACPIGHEHRYGAAQLAYHYSKDLDVLRRLAAASASGAW